MAFCGAVAAHLGDRTGLAVVPIFVGCMALVSARVSRDSEDPRLITEAALALTSCARRPPAAALNA